MRSFDKSDLVDGRDLAAMKPGDRRNGAVRDDLIDN